jgi:hypothetical protein
MKSALGMALGAFAGFLAAVVVLQSGLLPRAEAQAGPAGGAGAQGTTIVATGGGTNNQMDLCWVLTKVKPARGPERNVLALYRSERMGESFSLRCVRWVDPDLRAVDLMAGNDKLPVKKVLDALPQEEKDALRPPQQNP